MNAAGAALRAASREDLCDAVRSLQAAEKQQLQFEATLQVLRKEAAAGRWSWQVQGGSLEGVAPADVRPAWAATCRQHEGAASGGCGCGVAEPDEAEYNNAVGEATRALEAAVQAIHEAMDELHSAVEE